MKMGIPYEITDLRKVPPERKLRLVAVIQHYPGGLRLSTDNGGDLAIDLTDDDTLAADDEAAGQVEFSLPEGRIVLTALDLAGYEERVEPFLATPGPKFKTTEECQRYWFNRVIDFE